MVKIQDYSQQITPGVANTPELPSPNLGVGLQAVKEIGNANISLGETFQNLGERLSKHAQEQQKLKNDAWIASTDTTFRLGLQDKLFNEGQETLNINGQDVTRPAGILNRKLDQASGSLDEFDNYYKTQRSQYVSQIKDADMAIKLGEKLDSNYVSARELVIKNEAKQGRDTLVNSQVSNAKQQIHDAAAITDTEGLLKAVDNLGRTSSQISQIKGEDPTTAEKFRLEQNGSLVASTITSVLNSTGDLAKAQEILDSVQEHIEPDRYDKLNTMLSTGAEKIQRQQERAQTVQAIGNEAQYLTDLSSGKLSWMNTDDIARDVRAGKISEKFGLAMTSVVQSDGKYTPTSAENENYPKFIDSVFKAKDQEELHKSLLNILEDHKNISQEKLSVLINSAMSRGKNLPVSTKHGDDPQISPEQVQKDSGALAVVNWGRRNGLSNSDISDAYQNYISSVDSGKSVKESIDMASKTSILKNHPEVANREDVPNMILDKNSPIRVVFPKNVSIYPDRVYNSKTGSFEQNKEVLPKNDKRSR